MFILEALWFGGCLLFGERSINTWEDQKPGTFNVWQVGFTSSQLGVGVIMVIMVIMEKKSPHDLTHTDMVGWLQTVTYNPRNGCMGLYHYCTILYLYSCQIQSHVAFVFAFFLSSHTKSTFLDRNIPSHHCLFVDTLPKSPLPERLARLLPNRLPGASKWASNFPHILQPTFKQPGI